MSLWFECQQYHALPRAGGLHAQPAGLLRRMTTAANVYHLWRAYMRAERKATWVQEHPESASAIREIVEVLSESHD